MVPTLLSLIPYVFRPIIQENSSSHAYNDPEQDELAISEKGYQAHGQEQRGDQTLGAPTLSTKQTGLIYVPDDCEALYSTYWHRLEINVLDQTH